MSRVAVAPCAARAIPRTRAGARGSARGSTIARSSSIVREGVDDPRMSQIVKHGGIAYFTGQVGASSDNVREQSIETLAKCDALLKRAGTDRSHLLTAMVWLKDISDAPAFNEVWNSWIDPENKPTRACVQAELARPNLLVEVQLTAAIPN